MTITQLEKKLIELSPPERLRMARWLLDTVLEAETGNDTLEKNPLLAIAGRFVCLFRR